MLFSFRLIPAEVSCAPSFTTGSTILSKADCKLPTISMHNHNSIAMRCSRRHYDIMVFTRPLLRHHGVHMAALLIANPIIFVTFVPSLTLLLCGLTVSISLSILWCDFASHQFAADSQLAQSNSLSMQSSVQCSWTDRLCNRILW